MTHNIIELYTIIITKKSKKRYGFYINFHDESLSSKKIHNLGRVGREDTENQIISFTNKWFTKLCEV